MKMWCRITAAALSLWPLVNGPLSAAPATEILKPRDFPGWQSQNVCYPFVIADAGGSYRMYYSGSGSEQWNDSTWDQWVSGYVASQDTLNWRYPDDYEQVLFARRMMEGDLLEPSQTSTAFDSVFAIAPCIVKDGAAYRLWYAGWNGTTLHKGDGLTDKVHFRIGLATSNDGMGWTKVAGDAGAGAVLGCGSAGEPDAMGAACPFVLQMTGAADTLRMWYEAYDGTSCRIMCATGSDGIHWTKRGVVLDRGGDNAPDELGLACPLVIRRNGRYELWYQGQGRQPPRFRILRAVSEDAVTWTKLPGEVPLHVDPGLNDNERIHVRSAIVTSDGAVQVFFARQNTVTRTAGYWVHSTRAENYRTETVGQNTRYSIYTETLTPNP